jgi:hypothetical protein
MMIERMRPLEPSEGTGRDEELVVEDEAHRHCRETRVGVEDRDDRRHVGAADRHDQHPAEVESEEHHHDEEYG